MKPSLSNVGVLVLIPYVTVTMVGNCVQLNKLRDENSKYHEDLNTSKEQLCTETRRTKSLCQEM